MIEKTAKSIFNLPNIITMARILAVPFLLWSLFAIGDKSSGWRWLSVIIFIVIMASDGIDGAIARKRGLVTNLGKLLDPIADKALLGGALVALSILGEVQWTFTVLVLIRELGITAYRMVVIKKRVVAASAGGKWKTTFQGVMVGMVISPLTEWLGPWFGILESLIVFTALYLTIHTGVQYLVAAAKARD
ncbi:MAG: hypothetical protein RIQ31_432 [Actinomycetota bacterium]|jgi:CDP-diacylglycerol--glycerol-3-phosphate 3-phosphatidyltransferase